ncbi:MAG TPA: FAD-binding oxidoreductase [Gaiellaceae bacterium]|nr:FAD-binding oxidoreductase [Gaiellaceae bacterium]
MAAVIADEALATLEGFSGPLLRPGEEGYEEARRIYNGLIDRKPALIARCRGEADIVEAVRFAREAGLELAVRGGGHQVGGRCLVEGGVMVDLSPMKGIFVDPEARTARVQPGVDWAQLNRETQLHGLAVTGGVISTTGVAGLTLGGGLGWLMPKYGLATDNLESARVVTADGRTLTASESENPDLFWGLRGGGGNFGVVSSFEFRLHPVGPTVAGGLVAHPLAAAEDFLRFYRDFSTGSSDDLMTFAGLVHAPDGSGAKLAVCVACHLGQPEQAEADLLPLREFGTPALVELGPMPYTVLNSLLDAGYPTGSLNYWKSGFLGELSDQAIAEMLERFAVCPSPMTAMLLEHFHGAVTRVPVDATAVPHREQSHNFAITSVWADPAATDENVAWTRESFAAMEPFLGGRRYLNYFSDDDTGETAARAAYGPNYERLVEVKNAYDPTNMFRQNVNVLPRA